MKKINFKILILLFSLLFLSNCTLVDSDDQTQEGNNYGYETEAVSNILTLKCATSGCHNGSSAANGFSTYLHSEAMSGASKRPLGNGLYYGGDDIIPFNSSKSLLMQFVEGNITSQLTVNHQMLSTSQLSTIRTWIDNGAMNYEEEVPFEIPESYRVYVCNSQSENISVIDGSAKVVSRITDLNDITTEKDSPYWVEESGDYYYVTLSKANKFVKVRKSDNTVVSTLSDIVSAGIIKITSNGLKAYVSRAYNSTTDYSTIYVIDLPTMTLQKMIQFPFPGLLHGLALDENRGFLYVADAKNNMIHIISLLNDIVIDTRFELDQNYYPLFLEISPDGNNLYASASATNSLLVFDAGGRFLITKIPLNTKPYGIAVSRYGNKIYVASNGSDVIDVITKSGSFWDKTNTIFHSSISMPFAIDITSDDSYIYVTNQNSNGKFAPAYQVTGEQNISTITIINTAIETVEKVIEVEENALGIAVEKL